LRVIAAFGRVAREDRQALGPMLELSDAVQRRVTGLALARGRHDPDARVRAAAFRANWHAYGPTFLNDALLALTLPERDESGAPLRTGRFRLRGEWSERDDVFLTVFQILREQGLPRPEGFSELDLRSLRLRQLQVLMQIAHDFTAYSDRTRTAALMTLGTVADAELESLRIEDWMCWWASHEPHEARTIRAQRAALEEGGSRP